MKKIALLFSFLVLCSTVNAQQTNLKVEPPFWWSGMNLSAIQLTVYGEDIAAYSVSAEGVEITNVTRTENPNYQFVTIDTEGLKAGTFELVFSSEKKSNITYSYQLKNRNEGAKFRKGFDSSDMIYLIMPDRFANGNADNDGTSDTSEKPNRKDRNGRHGGDIEGIINHLDYIQELGATTLWSTPLLEDNQPGYSYHTYAISDCYKIDSRYGSNEDYKQLSKELHERDMKLVMDYVTNHWGGEHWMIKDLPTKEFINYWQDSENGFQRSSYRMTTQFDSNASQLDYEACMDGWFDTTMPDMNQRNPLYLNYIIQNAIWWIEFADLDGLRVDTYSYCDKEGISKWTKAIMDEYPNFNIVGEVWMHDQSQISYWQKDSPIGAIDSYNSNLPSVMDFTLHDAITSMFHDQDNLWDKGMIEAYNNFANDFLYADVNNILVFAANHDTNRINEIYSGDIATYKMIMTLVATVRGIPQFYYGDEIGMRGDKNTLGDGDIRRDFPGGWVSDLQTAFTTEGRTDFQNQYFDFTKTIFNWRKSAEVIHKGKTKQFVPIDNVYVYFRYLDDKKVMVVINNNDASKIIKLERFAEMLPPMSKGKEVITGKSVNLNDIIKLEGKSSMIIEVD